MSGRPRRVPVSPQSRRRVGGGLVCVWWRRGLGERGEGGPGGRQRLQRGPRRWRGRRRRRRRDVVIVRLKAQHRDPLHLRQPPGLEGGSQGAVVRGPGEGDVVKSGGRQIQITPHVLTTRSLNWSSGFFSRLLLDVRANASFTTVDKKPVFINSRNLLRRAG